MKIIISMFAFFVVQAQAQEMVTTQASKTFTSDGCEIQDYDVQVQKLEEEVENKARGFCGREVLRGSEYRPSLQCKVWGSVLTIKIEADFECI